MISVLMIVHMEDKRLVKRLLAGDERAFEGFFEENFARLYRFALSRLGGDDALAQEAAQRSLIRAIDRLHTYRAEAALFTWLCTICRNQIIDMQRSDARRDKHVVLTEDHPHIQAMVEAIAAPVAESPDAEYQRRESIRLIQVALDKLPARYGNVLEWKYIEGYSVVEIAAKLDVGREAAQSLIARAKRAFADVYGTLVEGLKMTTQSVTHHE